MYLVCCIVVIKQQRNQSRVKVQLLGEKLKGKYITAKQLNGPRGFEIVLKLGKCHLFQMNPHSKPISFANLFSFGV